MTPRLSARIVLRAGLLGALAVSCGEGRTVEPGPTPPPVNAVTIVGPASIHPGTSAQFTATLQFSDGTQRPATRRSVGNVTNAVGQ